MDIYIKPVSLLGEYIIKPVELVGDYFNFLFNSVKKIFYPPLRFSLFIKQMEFVGNRSFAIIALAGIMVGGIFGLIMGDIFKIFRAEALIGAASSYSLSKELGPVVGAMLVTGRAGSAMAAEIAIMRVNEQIDAMKVMAVDPYSYLMAPRIAASIFMMPLLAGIFIFFGILTTFFIGVIVFDVDVAIFIEKIIWVVQPKDLIQGLEKALAFGAIFSSIGCYMGYRASGGAKGVGKATTLSVVIAYIVIIFSDFIISFIQYKFS